MRSEPPTLEQLFAATRTLEYKGGPGQQKLRGSVAVRLVAAGIGLSGQALAGKVAVGTTVGLSALKAKIVVGLAVVGIAAATGAFLQLHPFSRIAAAGDRSEHRANQLPHLSEFPRARNVAWIQPITPGMIQHSEPVAHPSKSFSQSEGDALAAELELVRGAQTQLANGRAEKALTLLDQYFRRFPSGILRPEARVTRVRALCIAGRKADAEREASRFAKTDPDSPLAGRLQSCKFP